MTQKVLNPKTTVLVVCLAQILSMMAFATYPTLIPVFQKLWSASSTEIGWIAGIYFGGYIVAVGILVSITDLIDARKIYLNSMLLAVLSTLGFALLTSGVASASVWRCLQGIALAGTYMPGLKALVDSVPDRMQSRTVAVYTACFGVGVGVSFLASGYLVDRMDWQLAFACSAIGPAIALCLTFFILPSSPIKHPANRKFRLIPDFKPVLRNRTVLGFSIAYSIHNMELFVFRSWIVAYLVYAVSLHEPGEFGTSWNIPVLVAAISFLSQPFSVLTNEIAERLDRIKVILAVMAASATLGVLLGFSVTIHMAVVLTLATLYGILCMSDSASITAAVVRSAEQKIRGTTMAFHSMVGFIGAFLGPILFGAVLDFSGTQNSFSWGVAFAVVAIVAIIGPGAILMLSRKNYP